MKQNKKVTLCKKWAKATALWLMPVHVLLLVFSTGCMTTVTKYRTELVPVEVVEYRDVYQTVERQVEVPYEEEIKVPQYKVTRNPLVPPERGRQMLGFLPFTTTSGIAEEGKELMSLIEQTIVSHRLYPQRFLVVGFEKILDVLRKVDEQVISGSDVDALKNQLNLNLLVTGHARAIQSDYIEASLEVFDLQAKRSLSQENLLGSKASIRKSIEHIFYGSQVISGYLIEKVNKTRLELQQVRELVRKPFKTTKQESRRVAYEEEVFDVIKTAGLIALIVIAAKSKN